MRHDRIREIPLTTKASCRRPIERIGSLAGFDLRELVQNDDALGLGEAGYRRSLGFQANLDRPCRCVETL